MTALRRAGAPARLLALVLLGAVPLGCASSSAPPQPIVPVVEPSTIIKRNASDAFDAHLDPVRDRAAMLRFAQIIQNGQIRLDLIAGWMAVPELLAKGVDFLPRQVFFLAEQDQRWPASPPPPETAYVNGVKQAVAEFLAKQR